MVNVLEDIIGALAAATFTISTGLIDLLFRVLSMMQDLAAASQMATVPAA